MDRGARGDRGAAKPARVGERLDGSGAHVEERTGVNVGADPRRRLCGRQRPDGRAALAPLLRALLDLRDARAADRAMQRAVAHRLTVDGVRVDELEHLGRRLAEQRQDSFAVVRSEPLHDVARLKPQAGVDQADVAPRAAEADLDRLEGDDLRPRLGEPQRRREPRIAAADNRDVGANLALERRRRRRRGSGHFPKAVRERIVLHVR